MKRKRKAKPNDYPVIETGDITHDEGAIIDHPERVIWIAASLTRRDRANIIRRARKQARQEKGRHAPPAEIAAGTGYEIRTSPLPLYGRNGESLHTVINHYKRVIWIAPNLPDKTRARVVRFAERRAIETAPLPDSDAEAA